MSEDSAQKWPTAGSKAPERHRSVRVLRVLRLIHSEPGAWSRRRLAGRLGISERAVDTDLRLIRAAGWPLVRRSGGYVLAETERDAESLEPAGRPMETAATMPEVSAPEDTPPAKREPAPLVGAVDLEPSCASCGRPLTSNHWRGYCIWP